MLRNIPRAIPPLATASRSAAFQPRALSLASSTLGAVARSGKPKPCKGHICARRHVTNPPQKSAEAPLDPELHWIDLLEKVSKSSSLSSPPKQHENILKRCYFFIFHTTIYLFRPMSKDPKESQTASNNFLMLFTSAPVRPDTEIGHACYAIALIAKQLTKDITSIPRLSPLCTKHSSVFALANELVTPCDIYLENLQQNKPPPDGEIVEIGKWYDFWSKIQPHLLALGKALNKAGYGLTEEILKDAAAEKERKEKGQAK